MVLMIHNVYYHTNSPDGPTINVEHDSDTDCLVFEIVSKEGKWVHAALTHPQVDEMVREIKRAYLNKRIYIECDECKKVDWSEEFRSTISFALSRNWFVVHSEDDTNFYCSDCIGA